VQKPLRGVQELRDDLTSQLVAIQVVLEPWRR